MTEPTVKVKTLIRTMATTITKATKKPTSMDKVGLKTIMIKLTTVKTATALMMTAIKTMKTAKVKIKAQGVIVKNPMQRIMIMKNQNNAALFMAD